MVGGCDDLCKDPRPAFEGFARALLSGDGPCVVLPFLETSLLVYNGERKGDGWVEQWKKMEAKSRKESILVFASELREMCGKARGAEDVDASLDKGVRVKEISSRETRVFYSHPDTGADGTAAVWAFTVTQRGLEWLVSGIDLLEEGKRL